LAYITSRANSTYLEQLHNRDYQCMSVQVNVIANRYQTLLDF